MSHTDDTRGLRDLLHRATDRVKNPHLADRALASARRRRALARSVAVAGVATAVAVVAVGVAIGRADNGRTADPSLAATNPRTAEPSLQPSEPPKVDPGVVQPKWDPRDVDDLPVANDVASLLPDTVTPPDSATPLEDSPLESAVLSVDRGSAIQLLAPDGQWRSVPVPDPHASQAFLAPSGSKLSVPTLNGVDIWDLPTGKRTSLGLPSGFEQGDVGTMAWVDDQTLLLDDVAGGWLLDVATGTADRVPFPTQHPYWWTIDPDGVLVESADYTLPAVLTDWAGGEPHKVPMTHTGRLMRPAASSDAVAGTTSGSEVTDGYAAVVADRDDLALRAVLPVRDHDANYSNWALDTVAVRDDGTVVLWVAVPGSSDVDGWRLVLWDPESGSLRIMTRSDADPTWSLSFAGAAMH